MIPGRSVTYNIPI